MYITTEHFGRLTASEGYLWTYFVLSVERIDTTGELRKIDIVSETGLTKMTVDKAIKGLVSKGFIRVESKPRHPLVVSIVNLKEHDAIDAAMKDLNSPEPDDA